MFCFVFVVPMLSTAGLKTGSSHLEPTGPSEVTEELAGSGQAPRVGIHGCGLRNMRQWRCLVTSCPRPCCGLQQEHGGTSREPHKWSQRPGVCLKWSTSVSQFLQGQIQDGARWWLLLCAFCFSLAWFSLFFGFCREAWVPRVAGSPLDTGMLAL